MNEFLLSIKTPSKRIRIFLSPQFFLSRFIYFPVHTNSPVPARPHASDGIRIESRETNAAMMLVYCSVGLWTRFCYNHQMDSKVT